MDKEINKTLLAQSHEHWKVNQCTVELVRILDAQITAKTDWLESHASTASENELRVYLAQLAAIKQNRKYMAETTTFVKEVIK